MSFMTTLLNKMTQSTLDVHSQYIAAEYISLLLLLLVVVESYWVKSLQGYLVSNVCLS